MTGGGGGGVAYLLHGRVAHGVGVVVVVDDLKVSDGVGFGGGAEVNLRFSFTCSFSEDGEVSGFAHLHTCTGEHRKHISTQPRQEVTLLPVGSSSPVLLSPGPSARTLAASCEGSTFILKGLMGISCCARGLSGVLSHLRVLVTAVTPVTHLVSEQHHDGVLAGAWGRVLHRERVVVVLDDVKVDVGLRRSDHTWSTLDPDADITCRSHR